MTSPPPPPPEGAALPIDDVLDEVRSALREETRLIVSAPPGAGKTTRLPLALLADEWTAQRRLILLEPRRIAARAAAERLAATLGEAVGRTIGLRTRLEVRTSRDARIEVVTEGVFSRMILADPELEGVAGVLLDEFHERSLDADLALALALDAQSVLREDLRIIVMSATLDVDRIARRIAARRIASEGRAHPVETRYLGRTPHGRIEDDMAAAIRRALGEETGSILAFLPGAAEIRRTAERLEGLPAETLIAPLHGTLEPEAQTAALAPAPPGVRKIVLATDIAESSLTIEGVRVVIDGGLARAPRFDPELGASRLETVRISLASADQRRGRAGRTGPGVCYRLWREAETRGFEPHATPDILTADLSGAALDLARWGARSPDALVFLDAPPAGPWAAARAALLRADAITQEGDLTAAGEALARLPLSPRLARLVVTADAAGAGALGGELALLLSERDLGGRSLDLADRLARFRRDRSARAERLRAVALRWTRTDGRDGADPGALLARAFPERIARARPGQPGRFLLAGGRGGVIEEGEPLAREPWIVAADLTGAGADLRITAACRLDEGDAVSTGSEPALNRISFDRLSTSLRARRIRRIGAIILEETPATPTPGPEAVAALLGAVRTHGLAVLPGTDRLASLAARVETLAARLGPPWPPDFAQSLVDKAEIWLAPLLEGRTDLAGLSPAAVVQAAAGLLDPPLPRELDRLAPTHWATPAGRSVPVDYDAQGGPAVECRVQEVFGISRHPALADGRLPLTLRLTSPAGRPAAVTRDLPGFWRTGYADVRRDLRGAYPKHPWPEDPENAAPTSRAKPRG